MPLIETKGAASAQGFGLTLQQAAANYIEDVFSTWLYTGNGSTQTITNGIDLSTKGGLVWLKSRSSSVYDHQLVDTTRGSTKYINSNLTDAESTSTNRVTAFNTNGFTLAGGSQVNESTGSYASWTFREQPKFFDVVTYTGNGAGSQTINHSLGSVPGCMIVKGVSGATNWPVYHRSMDAAPQDFYMILDGTTAKTNAVANWGNTSPTSTQFTVGGNNNVNGLTYVAYLFAHDAGGFGLTGTDNVISCGSYTGTGSTGLTVNLGYEPQWLMIKAASNTGNWWMIDNMRGFVAPPGSSSYLVANSSSAEIASSIDVNVTSTGFVVNTVGTSINSAGGNYIYIAIRRGPMKTPTTGTSVYEGTTRNGTGAAASISGLAFPPDAVLTRNRDSNSSSRYAWYDKLRGATRYLDTAAIDSEFTVAQSLTSFNNTGESFGTGGISNANGEPYINWQFRRAPGFFDVVCYTGTGSVTTINHNLGVVPELIIVKRRSAIANWLVYNKTGGAANYLSLNLTIPFDSGSNWNSTAPTSSVFTLGTLASVNASGSTYVAYLFATVAGVSMVGSYTGTGALQTINCGFTSGARFVLIKRTDSDGDWYVWDSARGIVSGNDPYLLLNTSGAEVQGTDYVDTYSAGFEISSTAPAAINANGGTFVFLAIA